MASHDDDPDPVDEARAVGMTGGAAAARVAETLTRAGQDHQLRQTEKQRQETRQTQERYEAQAKVAEHYLDQTTQTEWMRQAPAEEIAAAWRAGHLWAEVDRDRFDHHVRAFADTFDRTFDADLTRAEDRFAPANFLGEGHQFIQARVHEHGADTGRGRGAGQGAQVGQDPAYDSPERRAATDAAMRQAGVPEEAREAKMTADHLNGRHPHEAAAAGPTATERQPTGRRTEQHKRNDKTRNRGR